MAASASKSAWVSTASQLPTDGQVVLAKMDHAIEERRVTFLARPMPRWKGWNFTSRVEFFRYWRPLP